MKQLSIFVITLYLFASLIGMFNTTLFKTNSLLKIKNKETTDDSKILWKGWIKYFHFESFKVIKRPNEFFINKAFFNQRVTKEELNSKSENIFNYINDKYSFYGVLLPQTLNILSERNSHYDKTLETMDIDMIKPLDTKEPLKGSIKDLGTFNEGSCISVLQLIPLTYNKDFLPIKDDASNTKNESWIICFENDTEKEKFYATLITYKMLRQKEQGVDVALRQSDMSALQPEKTPPFERYEGVDADPAKDGYLQLIQDWTKCTLKCGGGESFQQWRCIPNKEGGKPCSGELIRKKPCNSDPCPGVSVKKEEEDTKDKKDNEESIKFKPIFKSMPFIDRPQQDIPCQIKESDVLYEKFDTKSELYVKIPGRVVMNTQTISLFEDSSYDNAVFSFNLNRSILNPDANDECCFFMRSQNKSTKICALADCGTKADPKFLNNWKYSFSLFKNKCYRKPKSEVVNENIQEEKEKQPEISSTLSSMNIEESEVNEREKIIESKLSSDNSASLQSKFMKTEQTALKAITREFNLEERLKREEMMKAKEETKTLIKKMNFEKEKKEKLEEAIEEKETQGNKYKEERQEKKATNNIITETEKMINKKRVALKKKIMEIRKMTERRKRLIENKINLIRGKMTQEIVQASKVGKTETCKTTMVNQTLMNAYCDENIINDFNRNKDCKTKDGFCYICCESEFGTVQYNNRAKCYDMCDGGEEKKEEDDKPRGDWIWKKNN